MLIPLHSRSAESQNHFLSVPKSNLPVVLKLQTPARLHVRFPALMYLQTHSCPGSLPRTRLLNSLYCHFQTHLCFHCQIHSRFRLRFRSHFPVPQSRLNLHCQSHFLTVLSSRSRLRFLNPLSHYCLHFLLNPSRCRPARCHYYSQTPRHCPYSVRLPVLHYFPVPPLYPCFPLPNPVLVDLQPQDLIPLSNPPDLPLPARPHFRRQAPLPFALSFHFRSRFHQIRRFLPLLSHFLMELSLHSRLRSLEPLPHCCPNFPWIPLHRHPSHHHSQIPRHLRYSVHSPVPHQLLVLLHYQHPVFPDLLMSHPLPLPLRQGLPEIHYRLPVLPDLRYSVLQLSALPGFRLSALPVNLPLQQTPQIPVLPVSPEPLLLPPPAPHKSIHDPANDLPVLSRTHFQPTPPAVLPVLPPAQQQTRH